MNDNSNCSCKPNLSGPSSGLTVINLSQLGLCLGKELLRGKHCDTIERN